MFQKTCPLAIIQERLSLKFQKRGHKILLFNSEWKDRDRYLLITYGVVFNRFLTAIKSKILIFMSLLTSDFQLSPTFTSVFR